MAENKPKRIPPPNGVTFWAVGVLFITMLNGIRLFQAIRQWDFLNSLPGVSPLYMALSGGLWTIAGTIAILIVTRPGQAGLPAILAYTIAYAIYYWLDLLLAAGVRPDDVSGASVPFKAGMTMLFLLLAAAIAFSRTSRSFFRSDP